MIVGKPVRKQSMGIDCGENKGKNKSVAWKKLEE